MPTFTDAHARAGYKLGNPRNQRSAQGDGGSGVALTIRADEISKADEPWSSDCRNHSRRAAWAGRVGNSVRKKHIQFALDHLGGEFDLILCQAVDPKQEPRRVKTAKFWMQRRGYMTADEFNPQTGEFRIELRPTESK